MLILPDPNKPVEALKDIIDVCNVKEMPVHDRKDVLFVVIALVAGVILLLFGLVREGRWVILGVFFVTFVRMLLHTWHYELKNKQKTKRRKVI